MCFAGLCSLLFERGANVSIGIGYIDKKDRNRAQQTCHVDFCSCRKTTWKKTHRKRHFSFDTAVMALLALGVLKQKQEEKVVQPTLFTDGGSVKELLFESNQVEDGFPGMQPCKKILHSPYICHDSTATNSCSQGGERFCFPEQ